MMRRPPRQLYASPSSQTFQLKIRSAGKDGVDTMVSYPSDDPDGGFLLVQVSKFTESEIHTRTEMPTPRYSTSRSRNHGQISSQAAWRPPATATQHYTFDPSTTRYTTSHPTKLTSTPTKATIPATISTTIPATTPTTISTTIL